MDNLEPKQHQIRQTIYVVEPDSSIRDQIAALYDSPSLYTVVPYSCGEDFLNQSDFAAGCLIVGIEMPDMSTIDLLQALKSQGIKMPTIVLGENDDLPKAVKVMQAGALDFITKPFTNQRLKISIGNLLPSIF
jgi:two-component system, LuxR family, response regulator FixJ